MKRKEQTICFRTSEDLREALERHAATERRSLSATIELILIDHLAGAHGMKVGAHTERRQHARKNISLPAYVNVCGDGDGRHGAVIVDASLGGFGLVVPGEWASLVGEPVSSLEFELSMDIPGADHPAKLTCRAVRVANDGSQARIGARITGAAFVSYQQFQEYILRAA